LARIVRRAILTTLVLAGLGAAGYALYPKPVPVEAAAAARSEMRVTVDEDGRTRIKERYLVSAPLAGRLERITLKEGDPVVAGETVLASIDPVDPALLDPRSRAETEARVHANEAALQRADAMLQRANAELELAQSELQRTQHAHSSNAAKPIELERAATAESMRMRERQAAEFARDIARFELDLAKAALVRTAPDHQNEEWRFEIQAPVSGRVLRLLQESSAVVQAGTPLVEVGDPADLEMVIDILSSDAVGIRPGAAATIEHWGGDAPLKASVRRVEPAAFTKISALGVEEQRVNVILDFEGAPEVRAGLGDAFRVEGAHRDVARRRRAHRADRARSFAVPAAGRSIASSTAAR
jgi:HlyD family secretion protein